MAISAEKKVVMVKNGEIVNFKRIHYGEMFLWSGALWMKVWNGKREGDNAVVIDGNLLIPTMVDGMKCEICIDPGCLYEFADEEMVAAVRPQDVFKQ